MTAWIEVRQFSIAFAISILCVGCFGSKSSQDAPGSSPSGGGTTPVNRPPTILGTPPTSLAVGQPYNFQPNALDPDGDTLSFSIQNRPAWATFNNSTGSLQGTPSSADVGLFTDVVVSVSDGHASAALGAFSIAVNQIALGSVTMSWSPPITNADGSALTDLAGYRIYYGRTSSVLDQMAVINNAGTTRYVIDNLAPATWYFSMTSYNSAGLESARSTTVSRTLT